MRRIVFTTDPKLPRDWAHLGYRRGTEVSLPPDLCERWIRRGVAAYLPDAPKVEAAPVEVAPPPAAPTGVEVPADFDPATADLDAVRAFLTANGRRPARRATEEQIRAAAAAIMPASAT